MSPSKDSSGQPYSAQQAGLGSLLKSSRVHILERYSVIVLRTFLSLISPQKRRRNERHGKGARRRRRNSFSQALRNNERYLQYFSKGAQRTQTSQQRSRSHTVLFSSNECRGQTCLVYLNHS